MKIAVFGTGNVGRTIGRKLVQLGNDVTLGSRAADNAQGAEWKASLGDDANRAAVATYADAGAGAELIFNCTSGMGSLAALELAGKDALAGKILIDVANPLDFSRGFPPSLSICNTDSLGESIQRAYPKTRVVKTLNTVNCNLMVDPGKLPGEHVMFVAGNDADAKGTVSSYLRDWFSWRAIVDLGDITAARGTEAYLLLWLSLFRASETPNFNVALVR